MIKLIGARRAMLLGIMLAANLAVAGAWVLVIDPLREETEGRLNSVNGRISQLSSDTQNIKAEMSAFPGNYALYKDLERRGFFHNQDRFEAGRLIDGLREGAGLLGYAYKIDAIKTLSDPLAEAAGANFITSRVTIEKISSVLDVNVYTLMRNISSNFPPHTRIQKFEIKRSREVSEAVLNDLARSPSALVDASITLDWLTMPPKPADPATAGQPAGFRGR